jgi:CRP/FNR family transcriptional regulator, cyclic AMP receptor protein
MTARSVHRFEELLRAGRWFGALPEAFRSALLEAAVLRELRKGEWLFARGDPPTGLFAVVEGSVRIAGTIAGFTDAKEVLLALIGPPMWFGELSALDGQPRTHDAIAEAESSLVHVPQESLEAILEREPRYYRDLGLLVASKLRLTFGALEDSSQPLVIRLARRLVIAAEGYGEWHDRSSRVVDLTQEQVATMLATSRQTVNQLLKDLAARGLVRLSYGKVEIADIEALRAFAGASP